MTTFITSRPNKSRVNLRRIRRIRRFTSLIVTRALGGGTFRNSNINSRHLNCVTQFIDRRSFLRPHIPQRKFTRSGPFTFRRYRRSTQHQPNSTRTTFRVLQRSLPFQVTYRRNSSISITATRALRFREAHRHGVPISSIIRQSSNSTQQLTYTSIPHFNRHKIRQDHSVILCVIRKAWSGALCVRRLRVRRSTYHI